MPPLWPPSSLQHAVKLVAFFCKLHAQHVEARAGVKHELQALLTVTSSSYPASCSWMVSCRTPPKSDPSPPIAWGLENISCSDCHEAPPWASPSPSSSSPCLSQGPKAQQWRQCRGGQPAAFGSDSYARLGALLPVPPYPPHPVLRRPGGQLNCAIHHAALPLRDCVLIGIWQFRPDRGHRSQSTNSPLLSLLSFQDCGDFKKEPTASLRRFRAFFTSNGKSRLGQAASRCKHPRVTGPLNLRMWHGCGERSRGAGVRGPSRLGAKRPYPQPRH